MKISDIEVSLIDHCGSDISVVNAARTSFDKESDWEYPIDVKELMEVDDWEEEAVKIGFYINEFGGYQRLKPADQKLIKYLAKHKHFSPFNHSFISVRVKAPVFVARQLVKHKFMPWNEVSRRYVDDEPEFYMPPNGWRGKAENVKQGSSDEVVSLAAIETAEDAKGDCISYPEELFQSSLDTYNKMLEIGVCAELARSVLPQSMMTTWIWSGTLGAFCDMLKLRLDPHTQLESRVVAQKVAEIVKELFPVSYKALVEGE